MLRFNDFINENDDISDVVRDHLDKEILYKSYLEGISKYILEKYDGNIKENGADGIKYEVYGTTLDDTSTITFRISSSMRESLSEWLRSEEYTYTIDIIKDEIVKIIKIVESLNLDCAIEDVGNATVFRIDIFNIYFKQNKDLMKSLSTTKKYDL